MADAVPALTSVKAEMNQRATEIHLVLGDSSGHETKFSVDPVKLSGIADALIQATMDTSAAMLLGKRSALSDDPNESSPTTGAVIEISAAGTSDGAVLLDLRLDDNRLLRLSFDPELAEHLRRAIGRWPARPGRPTRTN